jgi:DNA polymerase II small subunit/DNA polymerase delta subunit B
MKRRALWLFSVMTMLLLVAPTLVAQNPNYNNGPVWRVIYVDVKPGMGDGFWTDIRQNFKPIYDEFKKQGWVVDYKFYTNPVAQHLDDWSVAIAIEYKSWGTLDEMAEKAAGISEKHYGSRQAMMDAAKKRNEIAPTLSTSLAREVTLK